MRQAADLSGVPIHPEEVRNLLIGLVHYHRRNRSIRVDEGGGEQRTSARRARDLPRSRPNKLREVTDVVIRVDVSQLACPGIGVDWGEAEVADVIRTALFVEQDVPIGPAYCPAIEVVDHRVPVLLAQ